VHEAVPNFSFDADIRNLTESVVVDARAIAIQWIAIGIGVFDGKDDRKVDFFTYAHFGSSWIGLGIVGGGIFDFFVGDFGLFLP
jgi:hypothetical protein